MPRRDVVLTGLIAFAAGCAVGANWPKIRKQMGPLIGKAGLKISEVGEFLSESFPEAESFFTSAAGGRSSSPFAASRNGVHKNGSIKKTVRRATGQTRVAKPAKSRKQVRRAKSTVVT